MHFFSSKFSIAFSHAEPLSGECVTRIRMPLVTRWLWLYYCSYFILTRFSQCVSHFDRFFRFSALFYMLQLSDSKFKNKPFIRSQHWHSFFFKWKVQKRRKMEFLRASNYSTVRNIKNLFSLKNLDRDFPYTFFVKWSKVY